MKRLMLVTALMGICTGSLANSVNKKHPQHSNDRFVRVDTNKNKALSLDEMLNFHQRRFSNIDKNVDGSLSRHEIKMYRQQQQFTRADKNHDGAISKHEFTLQINHPRKHHGEGRMAGKKRFKQMDTNQDRAISKEEMIGFYTDIFVEMDRDNDKSISREEMRQFRHHLKEGKSRHRQREGCGKVSAKNALMSKAV